MILLPLLLFLQDTVSPYPWVDYDTNDFQTQSGLYLSVPADAIYHNGQLFIADETSHHIFVIQEGKPTRSFAGKGEAPHELRMWPIRLGMTVGENLEVWSWLVEPDKRDERMVAVFDAFPQLQSRLDDKAGSLWNLMRWVSPRNIKETFVPPTDYRYPFMG